MGTSQHNCRCSCGICSWSWFQLHPCHQSLHVQWLLENIIHYLMVPGNPASVGVRWCDVWSFPLHSTPISANDGTMMGKAAQFFMSHMQIRFTDPPPMPPGSPGNPFALLWSQCMQLHHHSTRKQHIYCQPSSYHTWPITFMTFPTPLPNNSFHLFHPLHPSLRLGYASWHTSKDGIRINTLLLLHHRNVVHLNAEV